jgi:PPOX class probable FMN-dependent enzyme
MFRHVITSLDALRELMGEPNPRSIEKETTYLTPECKAFIARSPFMLLATSGANGRCDVAPKGDPPGFVRVLDDRHLVIPDRPGNKRFDGLGNIMENPRIGMIFLVPGRQETLRVNGRAWLTNDPELLDTMLVQGKRPWFALGVEVEECYMHCAKALVRSHLWEAETWPDLATVPTGAELLMSATRPQDMTTEALEELAASLEEGVRTRLY